MDLDQLLKAAEQEEQQLLWEGTFAQYLRMVADNRGLARLSHARIHDMITSRAVGQGSHGQPMYGLFSEELYGLDEPLGRLVEYLASAAQRSDSRHRILLLLGPPASGKSSIVNLIKKGLEDYSRTEEGALYAIKGCPMQEEPLHLIPPHLRPALEKDFGIYVEGDLCPRCRYVLRREHEGQVSRMPVSRVALSEREGVGIGTFVASEPAAQNAGLLVGSIDNSLLGGDRLEVAGRAYRLDGELNVANRGLMEFAEIFKCEPELLVLLLGLAQEQVIKMGRFGSVYADEAIIAHSNQADFEAFAADPRTEALRDRIITIKIPYNLRVSDELRIYRKLLPGTGPAEPHMAPLMLAAAATYAVLSRLDPPSKAGMSLPDKLRLYDGWFVPPYTPQDARSIRASNPDEGTTGFSSRYVMNRLSGLITSRHLRCVTPLAALEALWTGIGEHITLAAGDRAHYARLLEQAVQHYDLLARREVQRAFSEDIDEESERLFGQYWANASAFCQVKAGATVDERSMRRLEKVLGVTERGKNRFRQGVLNNLSDIQARGQVVDHTSDSQIQQGIESMLLPTSREVEAGLGDEERKEAARRRLVQRYGYCDACAEDLLDYVEFVLAGNRAMQVTRSHVVRWNWGER